jgi:cytochrome b subunit of formate dehydrogenase
MKKSIKITSLLAWLWFGITLILVLVDLPNAFGRDNLQGSMVKALGEVINLLVLLSFSLVGALIVSRQLGNNIGWLLMIPSLAFLLEPFIRSQITGWTVPPSHPSILFLIAAYLSNMYWLLGVFPVFLIALLFPTGKPLSPRWRWAVVYAIGMFVYFCVLAIFSETIAPDTSLYGVDWSIPNPLGFLNLSANDTLWTAWFAGIAVLALLCVASIVLRYRRAAVVERKQINWLLYAVGLFTSFYALTLPLNTENFGGDLWNLFLGLFALAIPVAIGMAILRYRLFDIDVIIRKTLVYAVLTATLALVFFGGVALLQQIFGRITGTEGSPVAIVLSTLAIAALFSPLRRRIQDFIDRPLLPPEIQC